MSELFTSLGPSLAVLGVTMVVGFLVALRLGRNASSTAPGQLEDLDEQLGHVMGHLRELADQRERLQADSYAQETSRLETRAAELLRSRDALTSKTDKKPKKKKEEQMPTPVVGFFAKRPQLRGALWGLGIAAVVGILWNSLQAQQQPRTEAAPPAGPMGSMGSMGPAPGASATADSEVQELITHLKENPSDVKALVRLGHILLHNQMLDEARVVTDRALQLDPEQPEALVHAAVVQSTQNPQAAAASLDEIIAKNPTFAEAWFFRGMFAMQKGDSARMRESFTKYLSLEPTGSTSDRVRAMLGQAPQQEQATTAEP